MAGRIITRTREGGAPQCAVAFIFMLGLMVFQARAEDLPDPTRPPAGIRAPAAAHGTADNLSVGLHTVIISDSRRAAIIDGQTVELGEEHRGARLVEVNESGVVMQRARSKQVLPLFPGVKINRRTKSDLAPVQPGGTPGEDKSGKPSSPDQQSFNGAAPALQELPANTVQSGNNNGAKPIAHKEGK